MNMDQVVIKREDENGDILLFYVDENGQHESVLTMDGTAIQLDENNSYIIEQQEEDSGINQLHNYINELWSDVETQRLLTFYKDNKQVFLSGDTDKKILWSMACKTMLTNRNPVSCEAKFQSLKAKYVDICKKKRQGVMNTDPMFDLYELAFGDDEHLKKLVEINIDESLIKFPMTSKSDTGIITLKKSNNTKIDEKVQLMLKLYLKYKKKFQKQYFTRNLWEAIAIEMGEEDALYWQKRFLNFKQHYISLLEKRKEDNIDISWPYMQLFDEIFKDDTEFWKKYPVQKPTNLSETEIKLKALESDWLDTEKIVLLKYNYDCFEDFQDPNISNSFLWTEIGRLLDKTPESCRKKYNELKNAHYEKYFDGEYDLRNRKPIEILCDSIISKDIELKISQYYSDEIEIWKTEEIDELVQFIYDNIEKFKDITCYFVCWGIIAKKLKRDVGSCRKQWEELVTLYKSILEDKKENPDMQIDWRYIELFDRIFDYGMDVRLLNGYEKLKQKNHSKEAKQINESNIKNKFDNSTDEDDESHSPKRARRSSGDAKAFKILEYYQKHKYKFSTNGKNKHKLWTSLSRQLGISESQCAHRFRNLKQVYTAYVQREINKPEMPIVWPYYALCKKVFGYRALKNKLKNSKNDLDFEEWSGSDIKELINFFAENFDDITNNMDDTNKWAPLAEKIRKTEVSCKDKFLELRKSYRKLRTQIKNNPCTKISWKYFNIFEHIYNSSSLEQTSMDVDEQNYSESQDDEDFQCIIVMPEETDISEIHNTEAIEQENLEMTTEPEQRNTKIWTKLSKKRLLIYYINYVRSNREKEIVRSDMWTEIAEKLGIKPILCKRMFIKLKKNHNKEKDDANKQSPYKSLLDKVVKLKPKFAKPDLNKILEAKEYRNVNMPLERVDKALQYYLRHIEDFVNPKFEKKFLWTELASYISVPVSKVFNKINYLKEAYNNEKVDEEITQFNAVLKEIIAKELAINLVTDLESVSVQNYPERDWNDEEIGQLLEWYLKNLDKFKNPKFVRSYLWLEISNILKRSALDCSKKMSEIRTQYRNMVKENSGELETWRFYELCQKIYGTGKKGNVDKVE